MWLCYLPIPGTDMAQAFKRFMPLADRTCAAQILCSKPAQNAASVHVSNRTLISKKKS